MVSHPWAVSEPRSSKHLIGVFLGHKGGHPYASPHFLLSNLRELDFTKHRLGYDRERAIVYEFADKGWRELNPHYGQPIYSLPPELGDLINLEVLKLRQNGFSELPAESGNLRARKQAISATFQTETLPTVRESLAHYDIFA